MNVKGGSPDGSGWGSIRWFGGWSGGGTGMPGAVTSLVHGTHERSGPVMGLGQDQAGQTLPLWHLSGRLSMDGSVGGVRVPLTELWGVPIQAVPPILA